MKDVFTSLLGIENANMHHDAFYIFEFSRRSFEIIHSCQYSLRKTAAPRIIGARNP